MAHRCTWFDIPLDMDRALAFYQALLAVDIERNATPMGPEGVLPHGEGEVAGCLVKKEGEEPSDKGPLLYLDVQGGLDEAIEAAEEKGGRILGERQAIGPWGHIAVLPDSEGNPIALHST